MCLEENEEQSIPTRIYDIELEATDEDSNVTSTTCSVAVHPDDGCNGLDELEVQYYSSLTRNVFSSLTLEWDTSLETSMIPSIAYNRNAWEGTRKGKDKKNVVAVQTKLILIMNYILNTYFSSFRTIRMLLLLPH